MSERIVPLTQGRKIFFWIRIKTKQSLRMRNINGCNAEKSTVEGDGQDSSGNWVELSETGKRFLLPTNEEMLHQ